MPELTSVSILIILLILSPIAVSFYIRKTERRRRWVFEQFAFEHNFNLMEKDSFQLIRKINKLHGLSILNGPIKNILFKSDGNGRHFLVDKAKDNLWNNAFSVICLSENPFIINFPDMLIQEVESSLAAAVLRKLHSLKLHLFSVKLSDREFNSRFVVFVKEPENAKDLLVAVMRDHLMEYAKGMPINKLNTSIVIHIQGNTIAVYGYPLLGSTGTKKELEILLNLATKVNISLQNYFRLRGYNKTNP